ncbi:MAG: VCBS repeat-containing protein [Bryobacteraceae bacterium]
MAVVAADFNGDGNVDLVVANENSGTIAMLAGNGNGTFQPAVTFALIDPLAMIAADFDQDGILDLAVVSGQSTDLAIMTGDGHGNFAAPVFWNAGNDPVQLAAGNFNADKLPDLVVANFNLNSVSVLLNTSTPATK